MPIDHSKPNALKIFFWIILSGAIAFGLGGMIHSLVDVTIEKQILTKGVETTGRAADMKTRDKEILTRYGVVDAATGVYRIPIARAMELEAGDPWRRHYTPPPAPAATPAATPAAGAPTASAPTASAPTASNAPAVSSGVQAP